MGYLLIWTNPYIVMDTVDFSTAKEAVKWIEENKHAYHYNLDNVKVTETVRDIDIYQFLEDNKKTTS